jgi:arylformamidase
MLMANKIIDISPLISADLGVWSGDTVFKRTVLLDTNLNDNIGLSKIETTLHLGAHTDAPNHYAKNASGMSECQLENYLGLCQVIEVFIKKGERIRPKDFNDKITAPRVLFKTKSFPNPNVWNNDFCALSAELVDFLAKQNVILVGIDTPSIDLYDDKLLESHTRVFAHKLSILEGIVLDDVEPANYELIALPLKLKDADASPVRAILRKL